MKLVLNVTLVGLLVVLAEATLNSWLLLVFTSGGGGALAVRQRQGERVLAGGQEIATGPNKYGYSRCPCIGLDNIKGYTPVHIGDTWVNYPADMGAHCEAWDDGRHPTRCMNETQNPGKGRSWCGQAWCYVDPCNCDIPVAPLTSSYVHGSTSEGHPVHYSFATCGSKDTWSKEHNPESCTFQDTDDKCAELEHCTWDGRECRNHHFESMCGVNGKAGCQCIGLSGRSGEMEVLVGVGATAKYPLDSGSHCAKWDLDRHPDCMSSSNYDIPNWCHEQWCFVDPNECNQHPRPRPAEGVPLARYRGEQVYVSYDTCSSRPSWSWHHHKYACQNQMSAEACMKIPKCGWLVSKTMSECVCQEEGCDDYSPERTASDWTEMQH